MKNAVYAVLLVVGMALSISNTAFAQTHDSGHASTQGGRDEGGSGTDGAPGNPAAPDRVVRVEALDTTFNVKQIQVRAGETIKFVIVNRSSIPHEFVIASHEEHLEHRKMMQQMAGMKMPDEPNAISVDPGQTRELLWKFGKDKDVEFACDIPGHAEQGMTGIFRIIR